MINRRGLMAGGAAAASLLGGRAWAQTASLSTAVIAPFVEVETASGKVRGGQSRGAIAFKGIPYAGSVSGANRFKAAPPVMPWTGVFDATRLGPPTMQTPKSTYGENEPAYGEDCLVLNVWTPPGFKAGEKRPVMVYFHGGGYSTGSAGSGSQDGGRLAAVYDVVVVAPNHRLGLLGFLYLGELMDGFETSGNQGMLDMVASLAWVRDNIAAFGGDPGNVTILGESGGGAKVGTLMGMPAAKGLFHKAGIASGAQLKRMPKDVATETARRLLRALGLSNATTLPYIPAQKLLELQWQGEANEGPLMEAAYIAHPEFPKARRMDISFSESTLAGHFAPVIDGTILPADPFDPAVTSLCADVPLFIGSNKEEARFFFMGQPEVFDMDEAAMMARLTRDFGDKAGKILRTYRGMHPRATPSELYIAIVTARTMGDETIVLAGRKSKQIAPVYAYRWDYDSNYPIKGTAHTLGAGHACDIGPTFNNWDKGGLHGNGPGVQTASRNLSALWTSFARTGVPRAPDVPEWPRYDTRRRATMLIDVECKLVYDPDSEARKMWARI